MSEKTIIVVDDRLWRGIARDTYTYGLLLALTGVGYVLGITALTWIGGMLWMLIIGVVAAKINNSNRMTISAAKRKLDEMVDRAERREKADQLRWMEGLTVGQVEDGLSRRRAEKARSDDANG